MSGTGILTQPVVRLTHHPLQRAGAFALLQLAGLDPVQRHPESLTETEFRTAWHTMTEDVVATARLRDAKAPGAFWLAASYIFWPNSKMNLSIRATLTERQRAEQIQSWRALPDAASPALPGVPCILCGQAACGFYGKVDVPLATRVGERNSTVPGHDGLALCRGCLASFYALPYGCDIRDVASVLHSWDDATLACFTARQVRYTRDRIAAKPAGQPYSREAQALRALRSCNDPLRDGVALHVFSNSNKRQFVEVYEVDQPLAEWVRSAMRSPDVREGFRYLVRAHYSPEFSGSGRLAYNIFRYPHRVPMRVADFLSQLTAEEGAPPPETEALAQLYRSLLTEAFGVARHEIDQITRLGISIGTLLKKEPGRVARGALSEFVHAQSGGEPLRAWLMRQATKLTLDASTTQPLVTTEQWRLLFEPGDRVRFNRDLLLVAVLEQLARHRWLSGTPGDRDDWDDDILIAHE